MPKHAKRTDDNHAEIREAARDLGWHVEDFSHVGRGFPDLLLTKPQRAVFTEVKDGRKPPSQRKLTPQELRIHALLVRAGLEVKVIESVQQLQEL